MIEKNVIQITGGITINSDVNVKNIIYVKKIWNPSTWTCENRKYLASTIDDSVITCDEITDLKGTNFNEKVIFNLHFY